MVFRFVFLIVFFLRTVEAKDFDEAPWGIDADLNQNSTSLTSSEYSAGFENLINFHQKVISEADGPRSHFYPSSSQYMLLAVKKYGFFAGFSYGCDRLIRENDERWIWSLYKTRDGHFLKYDPVP